jgi:alpha-L-rhamnosidase
LKGEIQSEIFNTSLFTPTQTSYILALHFDLLPKEIRSIAAQELVVDIERRGNHLSTGFVGSPYLPHVLSENGHLDAAYELLQQKNWPSWLYAVTQGATTIWERWDGWTDNNGFQTPEMNSFNHYAYGAIGGWMYNKVAGINFDADQPGYKHIILHPQPGDGLTYARASLQTFYGEVISDWKLENGTFTYLITIPPNTTATVRLPINGEALLNGQTVVSTEHRLSPGHHEFVVMID